MLIFVNASYSEADIVLRLVLSDTETTKKLDAQDDKLKLILFNRNESISLKRNKLK